MYLLRQYLTAPALLNPAWHLPVDLWFQCMQAARLISKTHQHDEEVGNSVLESAQPTLFLAHFSIDRPTSTSEAPSQDARVFPERSFFHVMK